MGFSQCKNIWSKLALLTIAVVWIWAYFNNRLYKQDQVNFDTTYYYEYLPVYFIYHDLTFQFKDSADLYVQSKLWYNITPEGKRVNKTTMGMAYLYSPLFFVAHFISFLLKEPLTGYTPVYYGALNTGCLFYLIAGLFFLRKSLLIFFTDAITALVLVCVYFGTNLFYYSLFSSTMPHAYLFALLGIFIYFTIRWNKNPSLINSLICGLLMGVMTLIRPTLIFVGLLFLFYGVHNQNSLALQIKFLLSQKTKLFIAGLVAVLPFLPQFFYWKFANGTWFYYSYPGEKFYFTNPHVIDGLFSYRKGWLLYTPIMLFALAGFWFMKIYVRDLFWSSLVVCIASVYLIFSWWCWWYGGSYGQRPMIDYYALLAFPMGAFFRKVTEKKAGQIIITVICFLLIELSLFQTWQMKRGLIHYDANTKDSYWMHFGRTCGIGQWWEKVKSPDYEKALRGEDEY